MSPAEFWCFLVQCMYKAKNIILVLAEKIKVVHFKKSLDT